MPSFLLVPVLLLALAPSLDVIPSGAKSVRSTVHVAVAPAALQNSIVGYRITEGDTFASIAKARLGDEKRATEIAELNPKVDAAKPTAGAVIWLPQTDASATDVVYLFEHGQLHPSSVPLVPGESIGDHYGAKVVAVQKARLGDYLALIGRRDDSAQDELRKAEWRKISTAMHRTRSVPENSRTARIEHAWQVSAIDEGAPVLEHVENRHFDPDGERVDPDATKKAELVLLIVFAVIGMLGLGWLAMRRRTRSESLRTDERRAA